MQSIGVSTVCAFWVGIYSAAAKEAGKGSGTGTIVLTDGTSSSVWSCSLYAFWSVQATCRCMIASDVVWC